MIYKYDKSQLVYRKIKFKTYLKAIFILSVLFCVSHVMTYYYALNEGLNNMSNLEKEIILRGHDEFTQEKLVVMMKELNVKFPWIPMAQSMVETGRWKSNVFLENNNLFGMKEAKQRVTTAQGTQNNHAFYESWRESVYDYAFYQCRYLGKITTESDYYAYLNASYAEDPNYVATIKQVIEKNKLKELFN